jgi:hypothetical protein
MERLDVKKRKILKIDNDMDVSTVRIEGLPYILMPKRDRDLKDRDWIFLSEGHRALIKYTPKATQPRRMKWKT